MNETKELIPKNGIVLRGNELFKYFHLSHVLLSTDAAPRCRNRLNVAMAEARIVFSSWASCLLKSNIHKRAVETTWVKSTCLDRDSSSPSPCNMTCDWSVCVQKWLELEWIKRCGLKSISVIASRSSLLPTWVSEDAWQKARGAEAALRDKPRP